MIIKDIKNILYDKKTLAIILLMPIVLMSILGSALKGVFSEDEEGSGIQSFEIAIVKEYNYEFEMDKFKGILESGFLGDFQDDFDYKETDPEKIFFEEFLGDNDIKEIIHYSIVDRATGEQLLKENKTSALIILPKNFVYNSLISLSTPGRNTVTIEIIKNSEYQLSADMAEMFIDGFTNAMNGSVAKKAVLINAVISNEFKQEELDVINQLMRNQSNEKVSIAVKEVTGEDALNSFQYYSVAIMTMFLLYAASIGGKALIEEKNEFTLQRLEVSGKTIAKIALSNFVRIMSIAVIQSLIMIVFSRVAISVEWGDGLTILVAMLCSSFAVGGLGMLVSVLTLVTDRYYIANIFEFGIVNLMALVGGSFIPVEILPKALQKINFIAINGSAIHIYLNGMKFRPMQESMQYILILLGMGMFFILCAGFVIKASKRRVIA
jgi:ABC-2 type transport system permease protein